MKKIIKSDAYWHKYGQYVAYLHEYEDGALMLEYTLEFTEGQNPCHVRKKINKLDKAFEFMCSLEDYDKKTKRPKKTKAIHKGSGI